MTTLGDHVLLLFSVAELTSFTRLFQFRHRHKNAPPNDVGESVSILKVSIDGTDNANDLISLLSSQLSHHVIFEPSEVVAFQLNAAPNLPSYSASVSTTSSVKSEQKPFQYPKHIYLDQFLSENADLANEKRLRKQEIDSEMQKLTQQKMALTRFNVSVRYISTYSVGFYNAE